MQAKSNLSYYYGSMGVLLFALIAGYFLGGIGGVVIVGILAILETSLSFDNAVVNASVLQGWDDKWKKIFLTAGLAVAVFGMRLIFPLLIVSTTSHIPFFPWQDGNALDLAIHKPLEYAAALKASHLQISGFGGAFLAMVAFGFFVEEKHVYWLEWIETKLTGLGQIEGVGAALTLIATFVISQFIPEHGSDFFVASVWGVISFILAHGIGSLLGGEESDDTTKKVIKAGIGGFLYLEMLDASFSFDGVIGAFALSTNIFVIMLGLMAGAMFVRSMTLHLVDKGTLSEYRYLEHGAFYAITALAAIMLTSPLIEVPEVVTGLIGAVFIGMSFIHSLVANKREQALPQTQAAA